MYLIMRSLNHSSTEQGTFCLTSVEITSSSQEKCFPSEISATWFKIIDEAKELLTVQLLFGLDTFNADWSGVVHEEPRDGSMGDSYFRDATDAFHKHRFDLLQAILTHPSLHGRFHFVGNAQLSGRRALAFHPQLHATN